jgi:hypothetical protein
MPTLSGACVRSEAEVLPELASSSYDCALIEPLGASNFWKSAAVGRTMPSERPQPSMSGNARGFFRWKIVLKGNTFIRAFFGRSPSNLAVTATSRKQ